MIHDKEELGAQAVDGDSTFNAVVKSRIEWDAVTEFCKDGDGHFFDDDTIRFFDSELHGTPRIGVDGHIYGVVSSKGPYSPRTYQVVRVTSNGNTHRPHAHRVRKPDARMFQFKDLQKAKKAQDDFVTGEQIGEWNWY